MFVHTHTPNRYFIYLYFYYTFYYVCVPPISLCHEQCRRRKVIRNDNTQTACRFTFNYRNNLASRVYSNKWRRLHSSTRLRFSYCISANFCFTLFSSPILISITRCVHAQLHAYTHHIPSCIHQYQCDRDIVAASYFVSFGKLKENYIDLL